MRFQLGHWIVANIGTCTLTLHLLYSAYKFLHGCLIGIDSLSVVCPRMVDLLIRQSLRQAHRGRNLSQPRLLLMSGRVSKDHVHILEALAAGLGDKKVDEEEGDEGEGGEEEVGPKAQHLEHVRGDEADDEIAHPRGRGGDGHGLGAAAQIENLGGEDPADGRKGVGEVDVVDVDEGDAGPARGLFVDEALAVAADDAAHDDEGDECTRGAAQE